MAGSLDRMMQGMMQKTDAQKAFSPWHEDLEDKLFTVCPWCLLSGNFMPINMPHIFGILMTWRFHRTKIQNPVREKVDTPPYQTLSDFKIFWNFH